MFWYCGKLVESNSLQLNINDPGLLYGANVFTTLRVYHQSLDHPLTNWIAHSDRLKLSLETFAWQYPDWEIIRSGVEALIKFYPVIRITIFFDGRELITGRNLPFDLTQRQQKGVIGWLATESLYQRSLANHKTGNYLSAYLALKQAEKLGAKEAILVDADGNWLETSTGNLWGWKDNSWWTPPVDHILPGVVRTNLIKHLPIKETIWESNFVSNLEAIAYSNSVVEIVPFNQIITPQNILHLDPSHPALAQLKSYKDQFML